MHILSMIRSLFVTLFLFICSTSFVYANTVCSAGVSDPDGDGWGWENNQSCTIAVDGSSTGIPDCQQSGSDTSGDGWGWENGQSCRVVSVASSNPTSDNGPACQSAAADADGDGWGWENDASCVATPSGTQQGTNVTPGSNANNAGDVLVNTPFSGRISGTTQQYYSFELAEPSAVSVTTNFNTSGSLSLLIRDQSQNEYYFRQSTNVYCLSSGSYGLELNRTYIDTANSVDYTILINTEESPCVTPVATIPNSSYQVEVGENGVIYAVTYNQNNGNERVVALDSSGNELWSSAAENYISKLMPTTYNDGVLVWGSSDLYLLDSQGQVEWRHSNDDGNYFWDVYVANESYLVFQENTITSLSLSDSSVRWVYSIPQNSYVNDVRSTNDGRVLVATDINILIFDE